MQTTRDIQNVDSFSFQARTKKYNERASHIYNSAYYARSVLLLSFACLIDDIFFKHKSVDL